VRTLEGILGFWFLTSHHCLDVFSFIIPDVDEVVPELVT
jgi:hypothetical protein